MKKILALTLLLLIAMFVGCESKQKPIIFPEKEVKTEETAPVPAVPVPEASVEQPKPKESEKTAPQALPDDNNGGGVEDKDGTVYDFKEAEAGDDKRGHYDTENALTAPIASYFRTQERINYMLIEHDMKLYQAMHGYYPKTAQDFKKEILDPARIKLPSLKPGCRFFYDPETGMLMVGKKVPPPVSEK